MTWLARLSFAQAIRWALVWPALVVAATAALVIVVRVQGNWVLAWRIEPTGPVPVWLGVAVILVGVLAGPSLVFLALWRIARR
jgi:hypothetical protein